MLTGLCGQDHGLDTIWTYLRLESSSGNVSLQGFGEMKERDEYSHFIPTASPLLTRPAPRKTSVPMPMETWGFL
jgi:hypothetical protein